MKKELKSGIEKLDRLVEQLEDGELNLVEFSYAVWNAAYSAGILYEREQWMCNHITRKTIEFNGRSIKECTNCGKRF